MAAEGLPGQAVNAYLDGARHLESQQMEGKYVEGAFAYVAKRVRDVFAKVKLPVTEMSSMESSHSKNYKLKATVETKGFLF